VHTMCTASTLRLVTEPVVCAVVAPVTEELEVSGPGPGIRRSIRSRAVPRVPRTHGRNTILELYIACHHPHRGEHDATDIWAKGHTDSLDPSRISSDERPIFDAHVICDKLAARCTELRVPAVQNIVTFSDDYCFLLCNATGSRMFTPLATHIAALRRSPDYHARQTRKARHCSRQNTTGSSWRGLTALSLDRDLPTTRTPWDGPRAYPPEKRHLLDCTEISDLLRAIPEFPRGAITGRSKTVVPVRISLLAGLTPLTAGPTSRGKSTLAECPFCDAGVTDTLHHCLYDCNMNLHPGDVPWCAEATRLVRLRFRSNSLSLLCSNWAALSTPPSQPGCQGRHLVRTLKSRRPRRSD
jgi:hypothetical protein